MIPERLEAGMILEWQGYPVLLLSDPTGDRHECEAFYLRTGPPLAAAPRQPRFYASEKHLWEDPLTDEEEATVMRLLLTR